MEYYQGFNTHLTSPLNHAPSSTETILGQEINANISICGNDNNCSAHLGPHGIDNRNKKGIWAPQWLSLHDLRNDNYFSNLKTMLLT